MYNGIGLPTPRGSGTSGYIQKNLSHLKPRRTDFGKTELLESENDQGRLSQPIKLRKPNADLLDHERRRQVEIKLIDFVEKLRSEIHDEDLIEQQVSQERERLLKLSESENIVGIKSNISNIDTHQSAKLKEKELKKFRDAFNIEHSDDANSSEKRKSKNVINDNDPTFQKGSQRRSERNRNKSSHPREASYKTHSRLQVSDSSEESLSQNSNDVSYNSKFRSLSRNRLKRRSNMSSRYSSYRQSSFGEDRLLSSKQTRNNQQSNRSTSKNGSRSLEKKSLPPQNSEITDDNTPIDKLETIRKYRRNASESSEKENQNSQHSLNKKKIASSSIERKLSQRRLASVESKRKSRNSFSSASSSYCSKKKPVSYRTRGLEDTNEDARYESLSCNYRNKSRVRKSFSNEALKKKRLGSTSDEKVTPMSSSSEDYFKKGKTYNNDRQKMDSISCESMLTKEKIIMRKRQKLKEKNRYRSVSPNAKAGRVLRHSDYKYDSSPAVDLSSRRIQTSTSRSLNRRRDSTFLPSPIQQKGSTLSVSQTRRKASRLSWSPIHRRSSTFSSSSQRRRRYNLSGSQLRRRKSAHTRSLLRQRESSLSTSQLQHRKSSFSRSPPLRRKSIPSLSPMRTKKSTCSRSPQQRRKSSESYKNLTNAKFFTSASSRHRKPISKSERNHFPSSSNISGRSRCSFSSASTLKRGSRHITQSERSCRRFCTSASRSVKKKEHRAASTLGESRTLRSKLHARRSSQSYSRSKFNRKKETYIHQQLTNSKYSISNSPPKHPNSFGSRSPHKNISQPIFRSSSLDRNRTNSRFKERSHRNFINSCGSSKSNIPKHSRLSPDHKKAPESRVNAVNKDLSISSSPPRRRKCFTSHSSLPRKKLSISRGRRSRTKVSISRLPSRRRNLSISVSTSEISEMNVSNSTVRQTCKAVSSSHPRKQRRSISSTYYQPKTSTSRLIKHELYSRQEDGKLCMPHSSNYQRKRELPCSTGRRRRSSVSSSSMQSKVLAEGSTKKPKSSFSSKS